MYILEAPHGAIERLQVFDPDHGLILHPFPCLLVLSDVQANTESKAHDWKACGILLIVFVLKLVWIAVVR